MKIFKENSYDIVRLYINQLGIMIFSMLLYTAVGSFENESLSTSLSVFVSIFSTCFYLALIYYMMWEIGAKDKIRIDGGRMVPCKLKGLLMGTFANLPNFVLGALSVKDMIVHTLEHGICIRRLKELIVCDRGKEYLTVDATEADKADVYIGAAPHKRCLSVNMTLRHKS